MRYLHTCPYCEAETTVAAAQVGRRADCPACRAESTVPFKVRSHPAPARGGRPGRREDPEAARRATLHLGILFGALGLLGTGVVVACLFLFTGLFDRPGAAEAARVDPPAEVKSAPGPRPKPKAEVKPEPAPEPKPGPADEPPLDNRDPVLEVELPPAVRNDDLQPPDPPVRPLPVAPPTDAPAPAGRPKPADGSRGKMTFPAAVPVELKPAPLAADTAEVKLPGKVGDAVVGGGGRYWCLLLPDAKQVAVFDANQAKVAKYLPLAGGKACLAAGMNKLLVVYPDTEVVVRYDLGTFEKEVTAKLPFQGTVKQTCLGAASAGPMLVFYGKGTGALDSAPVTFLDIATLKEVDPGERGGGRAMTAVFRDAMHYRASPDGRVYGAWATSHSPSGLNGIVVSETGVKNHYEHDSVGSVVPAPDGTLLTGAGLFTPELKAVGKKEWAAGLKVPGQQGDWYLSVAPAKADDFGIPDRNRAAPAKTTVFRTTDTRPVVSLGDVGMTLGSDDWSAADFTQDKRVLFSPAGGLIAWVAPTNDKLHLYKFDLEAQLEKSGVDYLFVTTRPPGAEPGKAFKYAIGVKSKKGGPAFKLDAGPDGMKLAADGTLTWAVPKDYAGTETVIITVSDKSGQEVFHTFTLAKATAAPAAVPPAPEPEPKPKAEPKPKLDPEPRPAPADPKPGLLRPAANPAKITPTKAADKAEVKLPGAADLSCFGGGGRYVLLRIPKVKQLAVFDVCEGKVAKYLPLAEEGALVAAGNEHVWVLNPTANVLQRWSLSTFEKEATVANPFDGTARHLLVGHATDGPVFVVGPNRWLDGKTFKEVKPGGQPNGQGMGAMGGHGQYPPNVRVSADGRVYGWWTSGLSPSGLSSMVLGEGGAKSHYEHTSVGPIHPGPDGTLFTSGGLYTPELKKVGKDLGGQPIPPAHGNLFLSVAGPDRFDANKRGTKVSLRMLGEDRPLVDLGDPAGFDMPADPWAGGGRGLWVHDRVFLVPDAKALVVLSGTADKLVVHPLDVEALLEKAGVDYLFVVSRPPAAVRGQRFTYTPEVKSKKGGVKVTLDAGPDGMKAAGGAVTWDVPKDFAEATVSVILTVSDKSGQETFHTFTLPVGDRAAAKPPEPKPEPKVAPEPQPKAGDPPPPAAAAAIKPTKAADKAEVKLPGTADLTCFGGGGRFVVLRLPAAKQIAVFDVCEGKVAKYLPLAEDGALVAAGGRHLFVVAPTANVIQRWSLSTFEKELTVANPLAGTPRVALMGHASDGPLFLAGDGRGGVGLLDPKTLKKVELPGKGDWGRLGWDGGGTAVRVSADGRVFGHWRPGSSPSGLRSLVIGADAVKSYDQHTTVGAILPGPDGTLFTAGGIYTPELKAVGGNKHYQYWYHAPIPPAHGNLYLAIPPNDLPGDRGNAPKLSLKMLGQEKVLVEFGALEGLDIPKDHNQTAARGLQLHDRVFLVPDAKAMVVLSGAANKLVVHKVDAEGLMDKAGIDYLFVTSRPPAAVRGAAYAYKPEVKSRKGGVAVKLDAGPDGMKVAADGTVTWAVPKDFADASVSVILTVSDKSGQETFHTFTLPVTDAPAKP